MICLRPEWGGWKAGVIVGLGTCPVGDLGERMSCVFSTLCAYVCLCVCVHLCLVFLCRNLLPTGSNTELCHSVKHFSWCTQKENYNLHGVWKRKGSAMRHEDSWYPTEDVGFSCVAEALCVFSKKYWPQKTSAGGNTGLSVSEWKGLRWECGHIEVSGCAIVYVSIYEFGGLSKFPIQ